MNIMGICFIAISAIILCLLLKKVNPEYTVMIPLVATSAILFVTIQGVTEILGKVSSFTAVINMDILIIPLKVLGIMLLAKISSEICNDAGGKSLAFTVKLSSKILAVLIALPLFEDLIVKMQEAFGIG